MGGGNIDDLYKANLKKLGTDLAETELVKFYPPPPAHPDNSQTLVELEKCKHYEDFAADPAEVTKQIDKLRKDAVKQHGQQYVNEIMYSDKHHELKKKRRFDFRLTNAEEEKLRRTRFMVTDRLKPREPGMMSFAEVYYRLYTDDMPVYVTTDSILHAWHRSFDAVLVDIEQEAWIPVLKTILRELLLKGDELYREVTSKTELSAADQQLLKVLLDIDVFLSTPLALLTGETLTGLPGNVDRISKLHREVKSEQSKVVDIFSTAREIDFSLFKPRGHYTKSEELQRYFQAMTWLGTIDFRITGGENPVDDRYQLQCAVLLVHLLHEANQMHRVSALDSLISAFVSDGDIGADSATPMQLNEIIEENLLELYIQNDASQTLDNLVALQQKITSKGIGAQLINGHPHIESSPFSSEPTVLPTSFALFGQRFVWSSFIFSRVVYDQVIHKQKKVVRRIPSAVDVAFTLFGNNAATAELSKRMEMTTEKDGNSSSFVKFRDGVPFTPNLIALRQSIDQEFQETSIEKASLSTLWIQALRELSQPPAHSAPVFQSKEWQLRQMNTQIASFTQLRHDTVLYAKQSYTMGTRCEYPDGFVDPYPKFWSKMQQLATRCAQIIANLELPSDCNSKLKWAGEDFFLNFAKIMQQLEEVTISQAEKKPLTEDQVHFMKTVMEERFGSGGSRYAGWYPSLFYTEREDSGKRDVLVADVHTDTDSIEHGDPGGVLHFGVGDVLTGFFVVDDVMYAGPVFSSYEFVTPLNERLNDIEFEEKLASFSPPQWALESYLCHSAIGI